MKAVRLVAPGRPLEEREIPLPQVGAQDVLVRVKAAGICHSDAHYRAGRSSVQPLPLTLGHEVAGVVEWVGAGVARFKAGDRVCVHYLVTCGECAYCNEGNEQFCTTGQMIGKHRDGGYAEFISVPARSVFRLPDEIPYEQGAILMCSSATSLHALNKARLKAGESVAIFGVGGLGISALQLARAYGASSIYAVDIKPAKLEIAKKLDAIPVDASRVDAVNEIKRLTNGRGVDVALELIGLPVTMQQAVRSLAIKGRALLVGITDQKLEIAPYGEILNKEAEIIGVSDHLAQEIPRLMEWVTRGRLNLSGAITQTVPLSAKAINDTLDRLEQFGDAVRVVITP
ncbi:MAG TPA: zinc-binding dehydrogenase [Verrucomicrobiae bacterium]|jgi:propanol-preferring alcohol dehydrogenase|nr:zinc-binding dehydrogenase [Verrucomicrobiae bacterium]